MLHLTRQKAKQLGIATTPPRVRGMNRTEARYAQLLRVRQEAGEIREFRWEEVKLRLADKTWYTPDFLVILADGTMEFHEVKGFMRDDANVKLKVAAEKYPWRFVLVRHRHGAWEFQDVPGKRS